MNTQNLIRWAGLPAMAAGVIFTVIQPIHPPDFLPSVTTDSWVVIQSLKTLMAILFPLGIVGLYARQGKTAGWLGLAGFLLFTVSWSLQLPFIFIEAFLLPALATHSPQFVEGFLTIVNETATSINLGALPPIYGLAGGLYMLGSLLFGIATFRAAILSRWAGALLAASGPLSLILVSLLPHHLERLGALPMGFAMLWLGVSLLSERRKAAAAPAADMGSPQLSRSGVN